MEENTKYPDQNENQSEDQGGNQTPDSNLNDYVQEVEFTERPDTAEVPVNNSGQGDTVQNNSFRDYAGQGTGHPEETYPNDTRQTGGYQNGRYFGAEYQNGSYENNAARNNIYQNNNYQNSPYRNDSYQGGSYQKDNYQNNQYQNDNYQNSQYQNDNYQNSQYQNNTFQNGNYQNNDYLNGNYSGNTYQNYGGGYQPYNGNQPYNSQLELEEPVKVSEWVLAMVLMMIPCVNIIMMFVWAFSSTEKKSKSNFFKAYLIFFGISMGVMLLIWFAIMIFALAM